jgi:TRAP-type C4-dicarboxylate transport system substrate-binding protein
LALPTSARGYQILLRDGIDADCDLHGRKIRGTPVYQGLIRSLGAAPVVLPAGEIYAALEKHVIDGAAWPAAGSLPFRWYEVTNYFLRPTFGTTTHLLLMNLQRFDALEPARQQLLLAEGEKLETDVYERFDALVTIEEEAFREFGLHPTPPCRGPLARVAQSWADGVWSLAIMKNGPAAIELREIADLAGLTESRPE